MYRILISPKDTTAKLVMEEVELYWQEGNCFCIKRNGTTRMYPMVHIWYLEILG